MRLKLRIVYKNRDHTLDKARKRKNKTAQAVKFKDLKAIEHIIIIKIKMQSLTVETMINALFGFHTIKQLNLLTNRPAQDQPEGTGGMK